MFDSSEFPQSLNEERFEDWLEQGRSKKVGYRYLLIIWDEYGYEYRPIYAESREEILAYQMYGSSKERESLVAAYDLYSQSKVT